MCNWALFFYTKTPICQIFSYFYLAIFYLLQPLAFKTKKSKSLADGRFLLFQFF